MATPSNSHLSPFAGLATLFLAVSVALVTLSPRRADAAPRRKPAASARSAAAKPAPGAKPAPRPSPVTWTALRAPAGDRRSALEKTLRSMLDREAAEADWGQAARDGVEASFELRRLEHSLERGVLRVHCAASGRLRDGRPAHSTFTLGGLPSERASLERRALTLAVRGVVVRLAELARAAARPRVRVASEPGEF
ncbi:MAG: hypothetical protein MUF34_00130 [Polyangiaceae bacterium]|nr:hypothetical protein [Polyangiaceae bacterium]